MDEERIALFLDFENLAIGAREGLGISPLEFSPVADALAERGRVVVRRAYADWSSFDEDRRQLTGYQVELIDIPQRMGSRKNAADIKLAVDAIELSFAADYITTFVIGTGDSDFTPLILKLRERNKKVIGIGVEGSTSKLLPSACDEFLFYDRLEGVHRQPRRRRAPAGRPARAPEVPAEETPAADEQTAKQVTDLDQLVRQVTQTLSGLKRRQGDNVLSSQLKRTLLRKDPTFDEAQHGFRSFGELLRHLAEEKIVELREGQAKGDPEVDFPKASKGEEAAFDLLRETVEKLGRRSSGPPQLSGLKTEMRKVKRGFSEKRFGYTGFLQFAKAARARGVVDMTYDEELDDYVVRPAAKAS